MQILLGRDIMSLLAYILYLLYYMAYILYLSFDCLHILPLFSVKLLLLEPLWVYNECCFVYHREYQPEPALFVLLIEQVHVLLILLLGAAVHIASEESLNWVLQHLIYYLEKCDKNKTKCCNSNIVPSIWLTWFAADTVNETTG